MRNQHFDLDTWIQEHHLNVQGPLPWGKGKKWIFFTCPWNSDHTNKSAYIVQRENGVLGAGCHHNSCQENNWYALRDLVEPGWANQDDVLAEMNAKHAVVVAGGKTLVLTEETDPVQGCRIYPLSSFSDFERRYSNQMVRDEKLGRWWINHPERRQYEGIRFAPFDIDPKYFNLYRGFGVAAKKGDCSLYLDHIRDNICCGDGQLYIWLISWMADAVQNLAKRPGTAIVLRGRQGTGKGVFARNFGKLFDPHFLHISNQRHLTGHFNAHLEDCLLMYVDEGFWAGDKSAEGVLKAIITEPDLTIERKGLDAKRAPNYLRVMMASNNDWVIPAGLEERRFAVFDVSEAHMQDRPYFQAIEEQMQQGGFEALLYYLQNVDLTKLGADPAVIPQTNALSDQKLQSMTPLQKWLYKKLQDGAQSEQRETWQDFVPTQEMYKDFVASANRSGQKRVIHDSEFGKDLKKLLPGIEKDKRTISQPYGPPKRLHGYVFPSLKVCREVFSKEIGMRFDWSEEIEIEEEDDDYAVIDVRTRNLRGWTKKAA